MTAENILARGGAVAEERMRQLLAFSDKDYGKVVDAMLYSVEAGGKRLRPSLLLEFYRVCGGQYESEAANFAAAIEFIHTYSLIHDDLPCMDDDYMRRGRPSCHIKFGEDTALLAGDALLTLAFSAAASTKNIPSDRVLKAITLLADYAGVGGMVGGQVIDLSIEGIKTDLSTVSKMYSLKTGALIKAAAHIGCVLAGADALEIEAALEYAEKVGMAFQIVDDILDMTSTADILGKPVGSDEKNEKSTYVSFVGLDKARIDVETMTESALKALTVFGDKSEGLALLAKMLVDRKK